MNQSIEDIIKNYNFFRKKAIISMELFRDQGVCNTTYLLNTIDDKFIVKKFNKALHVDKKLEHKIQLMMSKRGISSQPILIDIKNQIFISKYIDGYHKSVLSISDLKKLAKTLSKAHKAKIKEKAFDIRNFLQKNSHKIDAKSKQALLESKKYKRDLVLCHNDLNPKNILFSHTIKFIDWEFASMNDKYFDLAAICIEFKLLPKKERIFMNAYFKNEKIDFHKLNIYKIIYKQVCYIWSIN